MSARLDPRLLIFNREVKQKLLDDTERKLLAQSPQNEMSNLEF